MVEAPYRKLEYRPVPVKELLKRMRDCSWLMTNLAFSSVIYGDVSLAEETLQLEGEMARLELLLIMQTALATRSVDDAERIVSVYRLAQATAKIGSAAGDVAKMALSKIRLPREVALEIFEESGMLLQAVVPQEYSGKTIRDVQRSLNLAFDVLAMIRGGGEILVEPPQSCLLSKGDRVLIWGTGMALREIARHFGEHMPDHGSPSRPMHRFMADMLSEIRDASTLMVDLGYTAVMAKSRILAERVSELEEHVDRLTENLMSKIVSEEALSPDEKYGLLRVVMATEEVADAALLMVEPLLLGLEPHPIIAEVLQETMERISVVEMEASDEGKSIEELGYERRGVHVVAVRREGGWVIKPPPGFRVKGGDVLIVKYVSEAEDFVERLEEEEDREDIIEELQEREWEKPPE